MLRHLHLAAHTAHLILEKQSQRLHYLEVHLFGKPSYIVVRLDGGRRSFHRAAFDHVGIDGALSQPLGASDLLGLRIEYLHEVAADYLALLLRVGHSLEVREEPFCGIHTPHVESHVLVRLHYFRELVLAEKSRVNEDAMEVAADGLVEEHGRNG